MSTKAPLQNRMTPTGDIIASPARGLFMGNRGGRIHDPETKTLTNRRWASRRWICCVTDFKGRRREIMGDGYTELFFLDEATALAAGHRPCFECRREDAKAFVEAFPRNRLEPNAFSTDRMDKVLHGDRLEGRTQRHFHARLADLPDGAFVAIDGTPYALYDRGLIAWTVDGYKASAVKPPLEEVTVLTPECVCETLANGYRPHWHPSAKTARG
ncbi:hypothetical protein [Roseibium aggregatum]|uniref:Uncharacterized protein n=1 Tax=Roseibium aggregatum TaxID=187304 RepID=A0A926NYP3_9HYPH|nr:hypothetical protein [Roseibium aggregatum]MBD1546153.1 hypothetical protein [Roseibium aggregatum]